MKEVRVAIVVAVMATVIGIGSPAYAWTEQGSYPDYGSCMAAGQDGVNQGQWFSYYCKWVWGDYILWVA